MRRSRKDLQKKKRKKKFKVHRLRFRLKSTSHHHFWEPVLSLPWNVGPATSVIDSELKGSWPMHPINEAIESLTDFMNGKMNTDYCYWILLSPFVPADEYNKSGNFFYRKTMRGEYHRSALYLRPMNISKSSTRFNKNGEEIAYLSKERLRQFMRYEVTHDNMRSLTQPTCPNKVVSYFSWSDAPIF